MNARHRRLVPVLILPAMIALAGCDIITANLRAEQTAVWHKTYQLAPGGSVEIDNVNGRISVEPSAGQTVEVVATKKAKGGSDEAARAALDRMVISDSQSSTGIKIQTKMPKHQGSLFGHSGQVDYDVKVPAGATVRFETVNGGIDLTGIRGSVHAETTNGRVSGHRIAGAVDASTTNGGIDFDITQVADGGVKLECVNGAIKLQLPREAKADVSASVTNGSIRTADLPLTISGTQSRRHVAGQLNGGGPRIEVETVNGGVHLAAR